MNHLTFKEKQQIIAQYCLDHNVVYFSTPSHGNKLRREYPELTGGIIGKVTREFVLLGIFEKISKRRYKFEKSVCEKVFSGEKAYGNISCRCNNKI